MSSVSPNSDSSIGKSVSALGKTPAITYEQLMSQDLAWALSQGSQFFEGRGRVQETFLRITSKLAQFDIPYAIMGGMAQFAHGFRRYTENVDILVTIDGLRCIHQVLKGHGYTAFSERSKNLRDAETKVKIQFWISGDSPVSGKDIPFVFPEVERCFEMRNGIKYVNLPTLIALKLASGISNIGRTKDIGAVEEMILLLRLPEDFGAALDPYVREKYQELWQQLRWSTKRYVLRCPCDFTNAVLLSLDDINQYLPAIAPQFQEMNSDGVQFDQERGVHDGFCYLYTHDRIVAEKYGMVHADEFLDDVDQDSNNASNRVSDTST